MRLYSGAIFATCIWVAMYPSNSILVFGSKSDDIALEPGTSIASPSLEFENELKLAKISPDRDLKIQHLRRAVTVRPNDVQNILLEFKIGILLAESHDTRHGEPVRPLEALSCFEHIITSYVHARYYTIDPPDVSDSPEMMVPRSAVLAASILIGLSKDSGKARQYLDIAMHDIDWTTKKRQHDWENADSPKLDAFTFGDKYQGQLQLWNEHREKAKSGNVLGSLELPIAEAAVRQYGLSFGRQHPADVHAIMKNIVDAYPNSPLSIIAQHHIALAEEMITTSQSRSASNHVTDSNKNSKPLASILNIALSTHAYLLSGFVLILCLSCTLYFVYRTRRK